MADKKNYKGKIFFPDDYNKSFADFKADFENQEIFLNIPHKEREKALKEAHQIATKPNGNVSRTTNKGEQADPE